MVPGTYTDPNTSIDFKTWSAPLDENGNGAFTFGMVLPQDAASKNATEYIGLLVRWDLESGMRKSLLGGI